MKPIVEAKSKDVSDRDGCAQMLNAVYRQLFEETRRLEEASGIMNQSDEGMSPPPVCLLPDTCMQ